MNGLLALLILAVVGIVLIIATAFKRYVRCPTDKVLVIYGNTGGSPKWINGGAAFIWPIIQDYAFLDLAPISIEVNLANALSKENTRLDVQSRFTVGISTESGIIENAVERLLGLQSKDIQSIARDIIVGQMRLVVAMMNLDKIYGNRGDFLNKVSDNVKMELKKIGLKLINANIVRLKDEYATHH